MSRIGRKPIPVPAGVSVNVNGQQLSVKGPKGSLSLALLPEISLKVQPGVVSVERSSEEQDVRAKHGLVRNLVFNMVKGVTVGFEKRLEISGVGFKAEVQGSRLVMNLGYSHQIIFEIPKGIDISVEKLTRLSVRGMDAQQVGQVAAEIRAFREPDVYKAKGIRYDGEVIKVKAGKTGKK